MNAVPTVSKTRMREDVDMVVVRNRLSTVLGEKRMSIKDLERRTIEMGRPVSYPALLNIYHERAKQVELNIVAAICEALGLGIGDLFYLSSAHSQGDKESGENEE